MKLTTLYATSIIGIYYFLLPIGRVDDPAIYSCLLLHLDHSNAITLKFLNMLNPLLLLMLNLGVEDKIGD